MPLYAKAGGTWRDIIDPQVRVSGTWQPVQEGWVKVSGTWQRFYIRQMAAITTQYINGNSSAEYLFKNDGNVYSNVNSGSDVYLETWLVSGAASDFEARATYVSGYTGVSGLGSWGSLGSTLGWFISAPGGVYRATTLLIEVRRVTDSVVVTSANVTIEADNT